MRMWVVALALLGGCGNMPQVVAVDAGGADMTPAAADLAHGSSGAAPHGFGETCKSSSDCSGYAVDAGPGFLGCASYLGADYCTLPCGPSADGVDTCWSGSTCTCVDRTNAGGFSETDCFCAK